MRALTRGRAGSLSRTEADCDDGFAVIGTGAGSDAEGRSRELVARLELDSAEGGGDVYLLEGRCLCLSKEEDLSVVLGPRYEASLGDG